MADRRKADSVKSRQWHSGLVSRVAGQTRHDTVEGTNSWEEVWQPLPTGTFAQNL